MQSTAISFERVERQSPRPGMCCKVFRAGFAVLLLAAAHTALAQNEITGADANAAQAFLRAKFTKGDSGMVIGLLDKSGSRVFSAGKLGNGTDREVDGDTVFELGSVTKVFTSLLALESASRGEVKLDDPVAKYLPPSVRMPAYDGKQITLRHLAAQDSGLPFHHGDLNDWKEKGYTIKEVKKLCEAFTVQDLYAFLSNYTLEIEPGTKFTYSNPGMGLLGHVIELRTGQGYESLVVDRICRPLGMEDTRITLTPGQEERLARGHYLDGEPSDNLKLRAASGAGSLLSTANDLLKFLAVNLGFTRTALNPFLEEMQVVRHTGAPKFGATAMPWMDEGLYQPPGSDLLGHGGGGFGYLAFMGFDKKKRRAVVVLSNQMVFTAHGVGWAVLQGMPLTRENVSIMVREMVGVGLGFEADEQSGLLRITTVYPDSSSGDAGLTTGMAVQTIDGMPVAGKSMQECLALIRGPEGSKVRLEVMTSDRNKTRTVELLRRKFVTSSERIK